MCITLRCCLTQGHSEGAARGQREAEADAEEPASLLLGPAAGAGRGAPLDEEGGAPCRHQCKGEKLKQWHPKRSEGESVVTSDVCVFRTVSTVRTRQLLPLKRTCLIWTWASWGRRSARRARTSRAKQKSLRPNRTLAPEHTPLTYNPPLVRHTASLDS